MGGISRAPQKVKMTSAEDAWWYENDHSIDVIVETEHGTYRVRIERRKLADWIARTEPKS